MYRPSLAVLLLVLSLACNANAQNNWAAAACAGLGPKCPKHIAKTSGHCFARLWMSSQPAICRKAACDYCRRLNRRVTQPVCKNESIVKNCFGGKRVSSKGKNQKKRRSPSKPKKKKKSNKKKKKKAKSSKKKKKKAKSSKKKKKAKKPSSKPKPKPGFQQNSGGGCRVFMGSNNRVVIPANRLKLHSAWSRNSDGSMTWKKNGGSGIDPPGSGTICARFKVPSSGTYYMTAISKAPHPTEYNDAWVKLNAGFRLFRPQGNSWKGGGSGWMKGYQNEGRNRKADYLVTIDFNGHQFISNPLAKGREYQMCVAGRSAMYTIYQFVFIKCEGSFGCNRFNSPIRNAMRSLPPPKC